MKLKKLIPSFLMKFNKFLHRKCRIKFSVDNRPPRKSGWSDDAQLVVKFREAALNARTKAGFDKYFDCPVKLNLIMFAPNILDMNYKQSGDNDPNRYVGDLDSFVAGVCEYLQPAPTNEDMKMDPIFDIRNDIGRYVALIIKNDSQIVSITAKKVKGNNLRYSIEIEPDDEKWDQ